MLKFTIDYTDGDWPYAYQPEETMSFETVAEAEEYCKINSTRRDYYKITAVNGIPYHEWKKQNGD